jgi:hypothetical protein
MSLVSEMVRRASSGGLDKPAAALAALLAGAAVFAMPGGILQQAVLASGLPDSLPQLSPPLGLKARAGLGLLAAGSAFGMVLMAMRILAYLTNKRARPAQAAEGMPRVRRRDQHPDAPFRGPLSVSRDLGEPDAPPAPAPAAEREPASVPAPWPEREQSAEPLRPRPAGLGTRRRAPLIEVLAAGGSEEVEPGPAPAPEEPRKIKAGREAEPVASRPASPPANEYPEELADEEPEPLVLTEIAEPEAEPEPVPVAIAQPAPAIVEIPVERPPAPQQGAQESLAQLLARFEQALDRKSAARAKVPVGPAGPAPAAEPVIEEEGMDLRLRSALENLRRFAPRHG